MSLLTEDQYEEYISLLRAWVDAQKALDGAGDTDPDAQRRARDAYAAVESFRDRYGLLRTAESFEGAEMGYARG